MNGLILAIALLNAGYVNVSLVGWTEVNGTYQLNKVSERQWTGTVPLANRQWGKIKDFFGRDIVAPLPGGHVYGFMTITATARPNGRGKLRWEVAVKLQEKQFDVVGMTIHSVLFTGSFANSIGSETLRFSGEGITPGLGRKVCNRGSCQINTLFAIAN